jgi:hypothetical protein
MDSLTLRWLTRTEERLIIKAKIIIHGPYCPLQIEKVNYEEGRENWLAMNIVQFTDFA